MLLHIALRSFFYNNDKYNIMNHLIEFAWCTTYPQLAESKHCNFD